MQDEGFKENIKNHEVTFWNEDNIEVIFSLKCSLALDWPKNKKIYIKKVKKMNENIVAYKEIASNRKIINTLGQTSLPFE
jgi:Zn ribbon nucleic-acid-binding protein